MNLLLGNKMTENLNPEEREDMKVRLATLFQEMLVTMHLNPEHPHLKKTPERMAKMFVDEVYKGLYEAPPEMTIFPNKKGKDASMVFLGNIDVFSTCSHHFKDFVGKAHIAYIPNRSIVGISKLARITDWLSRRPQVQEELTDAIADYIQNALDPIGVAVCIRAVHNCIRVRGAKQSESEMVTTALRGSFLENATHKDEFYRHMERVDKGE